MTNHPSLDDKVALVTGASSGIGAAVARALARAGAAVVLAARRSERLEELADEITADGGNAMVQVTDVTRRNEVEALAQRARDAHGRIDVLVNNAGVMPLSPLASGRVEDWDRMVDVNIKGVLYGLAAVLPTMLEQGGGHIVNVGSLAGRRPFPGGTVYSATKFAVRALTAGIQLELSAEHGIRVTDVQPGVVATELMDHIPDATVQDRFATTWAQRRTLQPMDIANAVLFAVTAPDHVNVNEILVRPTDQAT
ncbi:MAG TPA: SDR family oxidoreductase [Longimicrobiales bacterium]|nr:SDR family oxidoreductase [Longimicrobiales bacterium]